MTIYKSSRQRIIAAGLMSVAFFTSLRISLLGEKDPSYHIFLSLSDSNFHSVATVDKRYVSFTLDWWPPDQGTPFPPPAGWGPHANVLDVDLQNPKLRALVTALGPSILRIGGTMDKAVQYDFPPYGSFCSEHNDVDNSRPPPCLNASRWDELHEFAGATNSKIVFGLSYPETSAKNGKWNATPAGALMRYSKMRSYNQQSTLHGFELGEELTRFQVGTEEFDNYVQAYHACSRLLHNVFDDKNLEAADTRPLLMGPCPGMAWPTLATWFPAFLNATKMVLDVAVYHSYNQIEYPDKFYLNTTIPSGNISTQHGTGPGDTGWQGVAMKGFVDDINRNINDNRPSISLWLGEMGPHNGGGGRGNISSTFASSMGFMDTLGTLARFNHQVLARQTLVGGKYELLRCSTGDDDICDFEPHPDYFVALLWSRLMGQTVLNPPDFDTNLDVADDWAEDLHFHAHCSRAGPNNPEPNGSITLAFSNKSPVRSFAVSPTSLGSNRLEYLLKAHEQPLTRRNSDHDSRFDAKEVTFNGKLLKMGDAVQLPPLHGELQPNDSTNPWTIDPASLGFVVFPNAGVNACSMIAQEYGSIKIIHE